MSNNDDELSRKKKDDITRRHCGVQDWRTLIQRERHVALGLSYNFLGQPVERS